MEAIMVGVDGSEGAATALRFAADEAALRKARLRIVSAWEVSAATYGFGFTSVLSPSALDAFRARAQRVAEDALATVKTLQPSVDGEAVTVEGQPARVLLEQAADVDLIVVGSRGHGGFTSLLLGSVSQQVVQHADRPVVVVHPPAEPA